VTAPQRAYASAVAYLLDRETGEVKRVMLYPITRIELLQLAGDNVTMVQAFNTEGDGPDSRWQEVTP
jgi:hypothetical protein